MIEPQKLFDGLVSRGVGLFAGVPDSLLASFCAYVEDFSNPGQHIITANEGNAVAVAVGNYMATEKIPVVYMQNSGLGNTVNPLTSLADPEVYSIPIIMIIGWRGEPGVKDEPQHIKQGRITSNMLTQLDVAHWVVDAMSDIEHVLDSAIQHAVERHAPVALLVRKNTFSVYEGRRPGSGNKFSMLRESALREILQLVSPKDIIVSTTGKTSREVFSLRKERGEIQRDFLTVGGMGHASSIALGLALGKPDRKVICIDGDGSILMHMGSLPIIGGLAPRNFIHILLNNEAHESVGGQPTVADRTDFKSIALAAGYSAYYVAENEQQIADCWIGSGAASNGPIFLEIRIKIGSRHDLGRPTSTPIENKQAFMNHVGGNGE